jgi:hypothetical protein
MVGALAEFQTRVSLMKGLSVDHVVEHLPQNNRLEFCDHGGKDLHTPTSLCEMEERHEL